MGSDPRTAIYAVRLLNVLLSALLLVCVPLLLRRVFPIRQSLAVLVALALLLSPGMSLRNSQVTNQVLAGLLVTVLYLLLGQQASSPPRRGFLEGAIAALAILTKLTAVVILPALVLAWWK